MHNKTVSATSITGYKSAFFKSWVKEVKIWAILSPDIQEFGQRVLNLLFFEKCSGQNVFYDFFENGQWITSK